MKLKQIYEKIDAVMDICVIFIMIIDSIVMFLGNYTLVMFLGNYIFVVTNYVYMLHFWIVCITIHNLLLKSILEKLEGE